MAAPGLPVSAPRENVAPQAYASDGSDGVGFVALWGNSPALDLAADTQYPILPPKLDESAAADEPLNVLISGAADIRHVLKTVARASRNGDERPLHFFVHETHNEVLARHMLFLLLLTNKKIPARERAEMFLSIYGNTLVREKDSEWVHDQVPEMLNMISSQSSHPVASVLDFSSLKFKDRDEVTEVFQGWRKTQPFDVESLRDQRLRGYYRGRYDYKTNLMDWDYHNGVKGVHPIIHYQHFKEFGLTGIAFETRLASYATPNRTMATYQEAKSKTKGTSILVRGFWADIVNPPFYAFGVDAQGEDKARLFKRSNDQYRENSVSISVFNVQGLIQEMETGVPLRLPAEREAENIFPYESPLERISKVEELQEDDGPVEIAEIFKRVKVSLIGGDLADTLKKSKFAKKFHRAFFGNLAVGPLFREAELMDADGTNVRAGTDPMLELPPEDFGSRSGVVAGAMADNAVVVCDSFQMQCHFNGQTKLGYRRRMHETAHRLGWGLRRPRTAVPRLEPDMKDLRMRELDAQADSFLSFVARQPAEAPPPPEPFDLSDGPPMDELDDEVPTDVSEN